MSQLDAISAAYTCPTCGVRPIPGADEDTDREVRISCPDATGLGCDISRLLLDFGLRIMDGAPLAFLMLPFEACCLPYSLPNPVAVEPLARG